MILPSERRLFLAATAVVGVHLVDVGGWLALASLAVAAVTVPRLPATLRSAVDVVLASGAAAAAALHLLHLEWDGFGRTDVTGLACALAAALFAAAGGRALLTRRRLTGRRRVLRIAATGAAVVPLLLFAVVPLVAAMWLGGKPRRPLDPSTLPVAHADVFFRAADGTRLSGWWLPSRNGAAVVLVHGGGGDRNGVRRHAFLLARRGYGVLLYDERGRGRSGGTTQSMGWNWPQDVHAAVDFVLGQPHVRRVGLLGLSTGAEVAVTEAARDSRVRAVVAEGMINRDLADSAHQTVADDLTGLSYWAVTFAALAVETGTTPPEPLTRDLRRLAPRPVLIIAARNNRPERVVAHVWASAAGPTARLWLARTGHTKALATFPRDYRRRVLGLFARALLKPSVPAWR